MIGICMIEVEKIAYKQKSSLTMIRKTTMIKSIADANIRYEYNFIKRKAGTSWVRTTEIVSTATSIRISAS